MNSMVAFTAKSLLNRDVTAEEVKLNPDMVRHNCEVRFYEQFSHLDKKEVQAIESAYDALRIASEEITYGKGFAAGIKFMMQAMAAR